MCCIVYTDVLIQSNLSQISQIILLQKCVSFFHNSFSNVVLVCPAIAHCRGVAFIFSSLRFVDVTPVLRQLHWLKVSERIAFKCCVLGSAPSYLVDELCQVSDVAARQRCVPPRLRSYSTGCRRRLPFRLPPLVYGTVCQSTSLVYLRWMSYSRASSATFSRFSSQVPDCTVLAQ